MSDDRFIDNGNDTITDSSTGLTWLKKTPARCWENGETWNSARNTHNS